MISPALIKILIAEDHSVVRQGLCALLRVDGHFTIVGEARTGREAVRLARVLHPDVILIDIAMPVLNGLEATRQILADDPAAKVLVLSAHSDEVYIDRMTQAGATGFLEKQTSAEILTHAIREVAAGRTFFSPSIARRMKEAKAKPRLRGDLAQGRGSRLTPREAEVLQLVAEGSANKQVAVELSISIKTVEKHRQHLMDKLNIHDTASLTRYAISKGIIEGGVHLTII
jgi:DNA-binding NarL/FixJ family response regulator